MNIKETAYHKYLSEVGPQLCFMHILDCCRAGLGDPDNMVWELFKEYAVDQSSFIQAAQEVTNAIYRPKGQEVRIN